MVVCSFLNLFYFGDSNSVGFFVDTNLSIHFFYYLIFLFLQMRVMAKMSVMAKMILRMAVSVCTHDEGTVEQRVK